VFAFITNFTETRTDGYKLLHQFRRVLPNRVAGIGEPLEVFQLILYISVPVNAGLAVYTYSDDPVADWPVAPVWMFIFIVGIIYGVIKVLNTALPAVPVKTYIQTQRQQFIYEKCVQDAEDDEDADLGLNEKLIGVSLTDVKKKQEQKLIGDAPVVTLTVLTNPGTSPGADPSASSAASPGTYF
jgi:hypothetical protein